MGTVGLRVPAEVVSVTIGGPDQGVELQTTIIDERLFGAVRMSSFTIPLGEDQTEKVRPGMRVTVDINVPDVTP